MQYIVPYYISYSFVNGSYLCDSDKNTDTESYHALYLVNQGNTSDRKQPTDKMIKKSIDLWEVL